jgi:hypothetical protein
LLRYSHNPSGSAGDFSEQGHTNNGILGAPSTSHSGRLSKNLDPDGSLVQLRNINIFQHIVPPSRASARSLALFTHAPISEFVYLLTGVGIRALGNETYSLTGGDYGWERWQALTSRAVYRILDVPGFDGDSDDEDEEEEEYEEPEEEAKAASRGREKKKKPMGRSSQSPGPARRQPSVGRSRMQY